MQEENFENKVSPALKLWKRNKEKIIRTHIRIWFLCECKRRGI